MYGPSEMLEPFEPMAAQPLRRAAGSGPAAAKHESKQHPLMVIDWPAWVQALGALAAILLAVWLPERDRRRARENYREAAWAAAEMGHRSIAAITVTVHPIPPEAYAREAEN